MQSYMMVLVVDAGLFICCMFIYHQVSFKQTHQRQIQVGIRQAMNTIVILLVEIEVQLTKGY